MLVIGYEGSCNSPVAMTWGAAAVQHGIKVYNAVLGLNGGCTPETWTRIISEESATKLEAPISSNEQDWKGFYVLDIAKELANRKPYKLGDMPFIRGVVGTSEGKTRTYHLFKSYDMLTRWLIHLHASPYQLVGWP